MRRAPEVAALLLCDQGCRWRLNPCPGLQDTALLWAPSLALPIAQSLESSLPVTHSCTAGSPDPAQFLSYVSSVAIDGDTLLPKAV